MELIEGFGDEERLYFITSRKTLNLVDNGVWSALTLLALLHQTM